MGKFLDFKDFEVMFVESAADPAAGMLVKVRKVRAVDLDHADLVWRNLIVMEGLEVEPVYLISPPALKSPGP